jgi:hypothetical protein
MWKERAPANNPIILLVVQALVFLLWPGLIQPASLSVSAPQEQSSRRVYQYRMKGKVRLLFFWVGKDDVGGGHITLRQNRPAKPDAWSEEIEVLFGSNPQRVPGSINRWGFGRERSDWIGNGTTSEAKLHRTVFEGFMRHSKEEGLSQVQANSQADSSSGVYLYDGIRSSVGRETAVSEISVFSATRDFDYRDAHPAYCDYQTRLNEAPPDKTRQLPNQAGSYAEPWGFLTAVRQVVRVITEASTTSEDWKSVQPSLRYVYNAQTYELAVRKVREQARFELPLPDGDSRVFQRVARVDFRLRKLANGNDHDFVIWFPLEDEFRGIPIRIVDKPRWWLHVELNLIPDAPDSLSLAEPSCGTTSLSAGDAAESR